MQEVSLCQGRDAGWADHVRHARVYSKRKAKRVSRGEHHCEEYRLVAGKDGGKREGVGVGKAT